MDTSPEKMAEVKVVLDDYKNTGNPDLLGKLRGYISEYMGYEGDEPVILELKETFHF